MSRAVAASGGPEPAFVELPEERLDFVHFNGMSGELYMAEMVGPGGALFDYDSDGDLDVFLIQGHMLGGREISQATYTPPEGELTDRLFRNDLIVDADGQRTVRFTDVTEQSGIRSTGYGMGVATGDYDNDGDVDLYVTNLGPNQMWRNDGDGTFTDVTQSSQTDDRRWSVPAVFFDYDRDGWLDLYVGNYLTFRIANHKPCPSSAGYRDYCGPMSYEPEPDRLFRNNRDGTFTDVTRATGLNTSYGKTLGAVAADFDLDGWPDLYLANDGVENQLWMNEGNGTFRNQALLNGCAVNGEGEAEASMGVDAGDFDNDGDEDLFMSHLTQETNTLYVNDGRGVFRDATSQTALGVPSWEFTGFGTAWFDYDNDGLLDVLVANGAVKVIESQFRDKDPLPLRQRNQLFRNLGNRFEEVSASQAGAPFERSEVSRGAAFGDIDNDGDTDVLIVNNSAPARLLVNQVGQSAKWIGLRLLDPHGRDALGAWVAVFAAEKPVWRRVRTAGSYVSANDPRLLFGLGRRAPDTAVVVVYWPDGSSERFMTVPVGAYTTLSQGTGDPIDSGENK